MYCQKWFCLALALIQLGSCLSCMQNCNTKDKEQGLMRSWHVKHSHIRSLLVAQEEMMSTPPLKAGQLNSELDKQGHSLNDNGPLFLDGPYEATVPEMSPEGTSVIQVMATYSIGVRLIYSILSEQPYFSVEPTTGVVRTAYPGDRETQDKYFVVIKATVEQIGGASGTTTVTINLSDVNDNSPRFQHKRYEMNVSEAAPVGIILGKIMADDSDIGENAAMDYIIEEDNPHIVHITTNSETQEGIVKLNKRVDYESQRVYKIKVKGINRHIDKRFLEKDTKFEDETILRIIVKDADEPPVFVSEEFFMEIAEDNLNGSFVGTVSAKDPDDINNPIRYAIVHSKYLKTVFSINADNGTISITEPLDREEEVWHNLTVTAVESINPKQMSKVNVYIKVLDVNEYAPEFAEHYETYVCENSRSGQKNFKNCLNLCHHEKDFEIKAEWNFFGTSHGKSPCGGIGGTTKQLAARVSLQRPSENQILTPEDLFNFCNENINGILKIFISKEEVEEEKPSQEERFQQGHTLAGTRENDHFLPIDITTIQVRRVSKDATSFLAKISNAEQIVQVTDLQPGQYVACIYEK